MNPSEISGPPLQVMIVEDEWAARSYLTELVSETGLAEIVAAVPSVEQARQVVAATSVLDAVFVDIHLAGESSSEAGLLLAQELTQRSPAPLLVMASAAPQHALTAFELGVCDYLVKPFGADRVRQCLLRLRARCPRISQLPRPPAIPPRIVARDRKRLVFLRAEEVWAFEAESRLTYVHTRLGRFDLDLSLSAIESTVGPVFLRVHRSWLVHLDHVRGLERDEGESSLIVGDELDGQRRPLTVPVARERAHIVREHLLASATGLRRT